MQFHPTASDRWCKGGFGNDIRSQPVDGFLDNAMTRCSIVQRNRSHSWTKNFRFISITSDEEALALGYRLPQTYLSNQGN